MSVYCKTEEEIIVDTGDYNSDEADENIQLAVEDSGGEQTYPPIIKSSSNRNRSTQQYSSANNMIPSGGKNTTSKLAMENEKRMRREIANSNERRRMQSINAGFQSLRSLLPHHEGEKLSKAAILQQTSQYIIELEREKTHLLSQNSQLKRTLGQHELITSGGGGGEEITVAGGAIKKRKLTDNVITLQTISDSSDEGLGSMSPEPITLLNNASKTATPATTAYISTTSKEMAELRSNLEAERKRRVSAEERLRQLSRQIYPANQAYIHRGEVIEHTDNIRDEELTLAITNDPTKYQVVEIDALPAVGQTQVVVCSPLEEVVDIQEDEVVETITDDMIHEEMMRGEEVLIKDEIAEYVEVPSRLQPILEAAIKAEPKVEVERINATLTKLKDDAKEGSHQGNGRMYLTSTSRQNLETIVEAIRHLEGDHLFAENSAAAVAAANEKQKKQHVVAKQVVIQQEAPLALTNKTQLIRKQLPAELSPFLQLKKSSAVSIETVTPHTATVTLSSSAATVGSAKSSSSGSINASGITTSSNSNTTTFVSSVGSTLKAQLQQSASASTPATTTTIPTSSVQQKQQQPATASIVPASQKSTAVSISAALKQCRPGVIVAKQISS